MALALASATPALAAPDPAPNWWQVLGDPALDALMARIDRDDTIIARAAARLALVRANARLGQAGRAPQVGLATSTNYAAGPLINAAGGSGGLFTATLGASWEPDLLGRLAPTHRADKADIRAADSELAATRLLVQVSAARAWYAGLALKEARSAASQAFDLSSEREALARRCVAGGTCASIQVDDAVRERAAAADRLALLDRRRAEANDALSFLLGERAPSLPAPATLPALAPIRAGIDSTLIERRPDVAAAGARLEAAAARHSAARRDWLPRFGLTAAGGSASPTLSGLLAGGAGSIGLGLLASLPLFDGGAHRARVAVATAGEDLATAGLREAVLAAWRDTNDALAANQQAAIAVSAAAERSAAAGRDATRAAHAVERGSSSRFDLAAARIAESETKAQFAEALLDQLDARLRLVAALGGGW